MAKPKVQRKATNHKKKAQDKPPQVRVLSFGHHASKLIISLILIVAILAVFWQVRNCGFINLDDDVYVTENLHVRSGLTLGGTIWALTTIHAGHWHPLTWLSHMLDFELYRLKPSGHHMTSLLFHIANTLLLFLFLNRATSALWASSFVAALFALHPLHVESVVWVAERKDVLSAFFWMLTMWTYIRYTERPGLNRYLSVLFSFALGLLSKPMLVTLPFTLLLLDYWPLGRFQFELSGGHCISHTQNSTNPSSQNSSAVRLILEKVPLLVLSAASSFLAFFAAKSEIAVGSLKSFPLGTRIANALVSYIIYIWKMIWPHPLAVFYPYPDSLPLWQVIGAGLLLVLVSALVIHSARRLPYLAVGWLWYLGTLVPVIGLVQVGIQAMADRFTYVPLIGLFMIMAWGVPEILARWRYRRIALTVLGCLLLSIFMTISRLQIEHWQNAITLFKHSLMVTASNYLIHNNLGVALEEQGKTQEAIAHYLEVLRIKPNSSEGHNNLGNVFFRQGKNQEAIAHYTEALRIKPDFARAHNNLGIALARQGKNQEAIAHYTEALRIKPDYADPHNNLGVALARQEKDEEAIAHYIEALRIKPDHADAHYNLGNALARQGRFQEAILHFAAVLRVNPDDAEANCNLGLALAEQGKAQEAITHYIEALRIKPDFAAAHFHLALAYFMIGNRSSALEEHKILKTLNPELANTLSQKIFK
jgi:tetratricopeptide (TPR) repeat protein